MSTTNGSNDALHKVMQEFAKSPDPMGEARKELADIFFADVENQVHINRLSQAIGVGVSPYVVQRREKPAKETQRESSTKETVKETGVVKGGLIAIAAGALAGIGLWSMRPQAIEPKETVKETVKTVTQPGKNTTEQLVPAGPPKVVPPKE